MLRSFSHTIFSKKLFFLFCVFSCIAARSETKELDSIKQELITATSDTLRARLLNDAAFLLRTTDPKLSLQYTDIAIQLSLKTGFKRGILNSYLVKGIIYKRFADYETAMKYYICALQMAEKIGDTSRISSVYNNIGSIYQAQNNYTDAISYFKRSLELEKNLNRKEQVSIRLYNLGTVYEALNKLDSAVIFYNQSLTIEESLDNDEGISFALYGLGGVLAKKAEYSKAETYLKKAYDLANKDQDVSGKSYCLNELGVLYMKWKRSDEAIKYFLRSVACADSIEDKNQIKETYHNLAMTYSDLGQYKSAYEYFELYSKLNEEINSSEINKKIAEINKKYELDKAENEIELVKKENRIKELEISQQKSLRNFLIFSAIIVIILGLFRYSRKKKSEIIKEEKSKSMTVLFEKLLLSKFVWTFVLSIYIMICAAFIQPFGLSELPWSDKWLIIAVYGAITFAIILLTFFLTGGLNRKLIKYPLLLRYIVFALINILLLSATLFFYNNIQDLSNVDFKSFSEVLLQMTIISLLPILLLMLFSERISYAENLKDIPLDVISQQPQHEISRPKTEEVKTIFIKTDNVGEEIRLTKEQIVCFEANDNYTAVYYLMNNKIKKELYRITLKKLEVQLLEYKEIIRCHKSYIINISHLEKISGNAQGFRMHMRNLEFEVPVSRSFPRQVLDSLKESISKTAIQ